MIDAPLARRFALAFIGALVLAAGCSTNKDSGTAVKRPSARPNIVFVMTDDMRYDEMDRVADLRPGGGFDWMRQHGMKFSKLWVTDNLCCPARATDLTGQTPWNHKVFDNQKYKDLQKTLPLWLQNAGYCTGFTGKYLNRYRPTFPRPRGWNYWEPLVTKFDEEYGYTMLNRRGKEFTPGTFITDRLTQVSVAQAKDCLDTKKPTFLAYWPYAPHIGSNPKADYASVPVPWQPTDPSFNEADISDKPAWLQKWFPTPRPNALKWYGNWSALRVRTLLSVDDGLKSLIDTFAARDELQRTVFLLTSDNGWFLGEHRIDSRKRLAYEAGQVALWIAGPGFAPGAVKDAFVTNLDLAPTIARAAGATPLLQTDGRTLQDLLANRDHGRNRFLPLYVPIEPSDAAHQPIGAGVRTWRYKYVQYHDGTEELYDLASDPNELNNLAGVASWKAVQDQLRTLTEEGKRCHGDSCRADVPASLR
jgi:arylsulfatase A-like enzyme